MNNLNQDLAKARALKPKFAFFYELRCYTYVDFYLITIKTSLSIYN